MSYIELARIPGLRRNRQVELDEVTQVAFEKLIAAEQESEVAAQAAEVARVQLQAAWMTWIRAKGEGDDWRDMK